MPFDLRSAAAPFDFPSKILSAAESALARVREAWQRRDETGFAVSAKVAAAFARANVTDEHLHGSVGPGMHDRGRDAFESLVADVMGTPAALARVQFVSGTHAIVAAINALAPPGASVCALTGRPYDTLQRALAGESGLNYYEARWTQGPSPASEDVEVALARRPDVVFIQRSRGYSTRPSLFVADIAALVESTRRQSPNSRIVVDNCYGEFVEIEEPNGADAVVGSLIKNPGGGMAPTGAYIAGVRDALARIADHVFAPGLGSALGATLGVQRLVFAGLHRAPRTVAESLKILDFAAALFAALGYDVDPPAGAPRTDVIQAIRLGDARKVTAFANGLQRLLPVNSHATVEPGRVAGYSDPVIMASGAFITGSTLELSRDAPLRAPYEVYLQGGWDVAYGVLATISAAAAVIAQCRHGFGAREYPGMAANLHRRQYARITVSVEVEFAPDGEMQTRSGTVIDLGAGGMRLEAPANLSPGAAIGIRFRLPASDHDIRARGHVLLSFYSAQEKTYYHGVAFTAIDPDDKKMLEDFVDEQAVR